MKHPAPSVAGILLAASALAVLSAFFISKAVGKSDNPVAARDWLVGEPVVHENLTLFPVFSESAESTEEFITLDEGLRSGKVIVKEMGQEMSAGARVTRTTEPQDGRVAQPQAVADARRVPPARPPPATTSARPANRIHRWGPPVFGSMPSSSSSPPVLPPPTRKPPTLRQDSSAGLSEVNTMATR